MVVPAAEGSDVAGGVGDVVAGVGATDDEDEEEADRRVGLGWAADSPTLMDVRNASRCEPRLRPSRISVMRRAAFFAAMGAWRAVRVCSRGLKCSPALPLLLLLLL